MSLSTYATSPGRVGWTAIGWPLARPGKSRWRIGPYWRQFSGEFHPERRGNPRCPSQEHAFQTPTPSIHAETDAAGRRRAVLRTSRYGVESESRHVRATRATC